MPCWYFNGNRLFISQGEVHNGNPNNFQVTTFTEMKRCLGRPLQQQWIGCLNLGINTQTRNWLDVWNSTGLQSLEIMSRPLRDITSIFQLKPTFLHTNRSRLNTSLHCLWRCLGRQCVWNKQFLTIPVICYDWWLKVRLLALLVSVHHLCKGFFF